MKVWGCWHHAVMQVPHSNGLASMVAQLTCSVCTYDGLRLGAAIWHVALAALREYKSWWQLATLDDATIFLIDVAVATLCLIILHVNAVALMSGKDGCGTVVTCGAAVWLCCNYDR